MAKRKDYGFKSLIETLLIAALIILIFFMMGNVRQLQGTARIVNYAGIVRGATQRLVKLEIMGEPNYELEEYLDDIINGLRHGDSQLSLVKLNDDNYEEKLLALSDYWIKLKDEIKKGRENGMGETQILDMSEEYFQLADDTVSAAEEYSQSCATRLKYVEAGLIAVIAVLIVIMIKHSVQALKLLRDNRALSQKAYVDLHTGLPNKSRCEELIKNHDVISEPTCCMVLDMNNLKRANDTLGHVAGDTMIKNFATLIRKTVPQKHFVGRYGGDEFVIIMRDISFDDIGIVIKKIEDEVKYFNDNGVNDSKAGLYISYACGYAFSEDYPECTMQILVEKADQNMYIDKQEKHAQQ